MNLLKRFITWILHRKVSEIDKLYQRHAGEECYIFGTGTSIKWMDLGHFKDKVSILGNMAIYHKDALSLNAPYCTMIEPFAFYSYQPYRGYGKLQFIRNYIGKEFLKIIKNAPRVLFFINISNFPVAKFSNVVFVNKRYIPPFEEKNPFKDRPDTHDGTLKFQLSLAIFLGFKKAYLVGHDYTHRNSKSLHFYEKGEGVLNGNKNFCKDFIEYAKNHIELVTVTIDDSSETMDSIEYKKLTGQVPKFRENVDIVEYEKLRSLATWDGYSIF